MKEEKVFKDPLHRYISVKDETIWRLINTREFQRLRRIRQLGTSYLTFHGAEHSRFSHSLGVYEITRYIISQFERNGYEDFPYEERLLCLCAALLHDIGHGPFSHSIEEVFETRHEEWSSRLVLEDTEVHAVLADVSPDFPAKVASVIDKTYPNKAVISLISSQLDADRMDYLLRDSYFTGVSYGTFDLHRIMRVMRPYKGGIVVKESGMHAIEAYLMARYQMYWQVYFHPVTRSAEMLLGFALERARHLYEQGYDFDFMLDPLEKLLSRQMTVESYIQLDESLMQTAFHYWARERDPILSDLCGRFMNRRLFKYAEVEQPGNEACRAIEAALAGIGLDPRYYMKVDYPSNLSYNIYRPGENANLPILLLDSNDRLTEISEKSDIVRSISGMQRGKNHLYYPEELLKLVSEAERNQLQKLLNL